MFSVKIYELGNNGELTSLSRLPITISNSIAKKDDYIYISARKLPFYNQPGKLYQINIENKQNPIITNEINFDHNPWPIEIYDDVLRAAFNSFCAKLLLLVRIITKLLFLKLSFGTSVTTIPIS